MPFFPAFPYSYNNGKNYYYKFQNKKNNYYNIIEKSQNNSKKIEKNQKKSEKLENNNFSDNFDDYNFFLNLFGINLYFDDILIICILFFLYSERVRDEELFLCLILLLLS